MWKQNSDNVLSPARASDGAPLKSCQGRLYTRTVYTHLVRGFLDHISLQPCATRILNVYALPKPQRTRMHIPLDWYKVTLRQNYNFKKCNHLKHLVHVINNRNSYCTHVCVCRGAVFSIILSTHVSHFDCQYKKLTKILLFWWSILRTWEIHNGNWIITHRIII